MTIAIGLDDHCQYNIQYPSFKCLDCQLNTILLGEYYMVQNEIWDRIVPGGKGMLCIQHLEERLGRKLTPADFTEAPVNRDYGDMSSRLLNRLGVTSSLGTN